jgi:hypothetical protein
VRACGDLCGAAKDMTGSWPVSRDEDLARTLDLYSISLPVLTKADSGCAFISALKTTNRRKPMADKAQAHVAVSKAAAHGHPQVYVMVSPTVTSAQLGSIVGKVATNEAILKAAGLKICGGCKSGLDIHILDQGEMFQVEV